MSTFSETCIKLEARNPLLFRTVQCASIAVMILFVAGATGLVRLLWGAVVDRVHDPLISAVVVGTIVASVIAVAVTLLTSGERG